jgi:hypothetical protein
MKNVGNIAFSDLEMFPFFSCIEPSAQQPGTLIVNARRRNFVAGGHVK